MVGPGPRVLHFMGKVAGTASSASLCGVRIAQNTPVRLRVLLDLYRSACSRRPWKKAISISTKQMYLLSYEKGK